MLDRGALLQAAGLGVALVPAWARALPLADVVFRDVADAVSVEVCLAWRRGDDGGDTGSPPVRSVLEALEASGIVAGEASRAS